MPENKFRNSYMPIKNCVWKTEFNDLRLKMWYILFFLLLIFMFWFTFYVLTYVRVIIYFLGIKYAMNMLILQIIVKVGSPPWLSNIFACGW